MSTHISQATRKNITAYLFILPGVVLFLIFVIYPILKAFQMSFYEWSVMPNVPNVFVGLKNYIQAYNDPVIRRALVNTTLYVIVTVPGQMILALAVALFVNRISKGKVFFRILYYLPVITSWVVVSLLFKYLFQSPKGIINNFLVNVFHIIPLPVAWLQNTPSAFVPIWALGIWKGIGWGMVIFLAALTSVPHELYEAAEIDGANAWGKLLYITLPLIRPTLVFVLVVLMIGGFNVFTSVLLITDGGPLQRTEVILTYMYHQAFDYLNFGFGAAISFILAAIIIVLSFIQVRFLRKPEEIT
jgi:multiple sugar transport system permease protein